MYIEHVQTTGRTVTRTGGVADLELGEGVGVVSQAQWVEGAARVQPGATQKHQ